MYLNIFFFSSNNLIIKTLHLRLHLRRLVDVLIQNGLLRLEPKTLPSVAQQLIRRASAAPYSVFNSSVRSADEIFWKTVNVCGGEPREEKHADGNVGEGKVYKKKKKEETLVSVEILSARLRVGIPACSWCPVLSCGRLHSLHITSASTTHTHTHSGFLLCLKQTRVKGDQSSAPLISSPKKTQNSYSAKSLSSRSLASVIGTPVSLLFHANIQSRVGGAVHKTLTDTEQALHVKPKTSHQQQFCGRERRTSRADREATLIRITALCNRAEQKSISKCTARSTRHRHNY